MKVLYFDIETLRGLILFTFWNKETDQWWEFEISDYKNDIYAFKRFMEEMAPDFHFVGFNAVSFDSQVIEYVIRSIDRWFDLSNRAIMGLIYNKAQDTIEDANFDQFPSYREDEVSFRQIDVFKIPHFDNQARRCSLKWLEFMMNMPNIEEMPYPHTQEVFTESEVQEIKDYCRNDIINTAQWTLYMMGEVEHEMYKGKNKLQDRWDAIEEFKFPGRAINWSDVKIGDELNKLGYCQLTGKTVSDLYNLKYNRGATKKFTFGECIPKYVGFVTPEFQAFLLSVKDVKVSLDSDKQEFPFSYNGTNYLIAKGGIHSVEGNRVVVPTENEILRDADIGSQYPNAIVKRGLYPSHLGLEWLVNYKKTIETRIEYKSKSKDNAKYKGLSEQYKLALNGGGFGKTNERTSWQYDPKVTFYCTIGNQFEILMLIEMLETHGIRVISANTDGIVCLFNKDLEDVYKAQCKEWEVKVGNDKMGMLEYQDYIKLWQESINHYIAIKPDGEIKVKGRFDVYGELNKNNTDKIERITRLAIQEWVKKGTPPEETINNCEDIYMFCIGKKASRDYRWETIKDGQRTQYQRLIRFYISKQGEKLIKVKNEDSDASGNKITEFFKDWPIKICNRISEANIEEVDRSYYINNAKDIIAKIEGMKSNKKVYNNPAQTSLF